MPNRPRVTAYYEAPATTTKHLCDPRSHTTPGVSLTVEFDLHDHQAALDLLERAVADVRGQIEQTEEA